MGKSRIHKFILLGLVALILMQASIVILSYARSSFIFNAEPVVHFLGLPLGKVADSDISYASFRTNVTTAARAMADSQLSSSEINTGVWQKLKREAILLQIAKSNKIQISEAELKQAEKVYFETANTPEQRAELLKTYNLTPSQMLDQFIRPLLLEDKVRKWYAQLPNTPELTSVQGLVKQFSTNTADFDQIAATLGSTDTKNVTEHIVPEEDLQGAYQQIYGLEANQVSPVIASADGYRLFKVVAIIEDENNKKFYQLHELFFPLTSFDTYLDQQIKNAREKIYFPSVVSSK